MCWRLDIQKPAVVKLVVFLPDCCSDWSVFIQIHGKRTFGIELPVSSKKMSKQVGRMGKMNTHAPGTMTELHYLCWLHVIHHWAPDSKHFISLFFIWCKDASGRIANLQFIILAHNHELFGLYFKQYTWYKGGKNVFPDLFVGQYYVKHCFL